MTKAITAPSSSVLEAFGATTDDPEFLPAGQGVSFLVGSMVLKQVTNAALHHDMAKVSVRAAAAGAPLVIPVCSTAGTFVVDGWTATELIPTTGHEWEHADCDWYAVFDAARRLHGALSEIEIPASFRVFRSRSRWAQADAAVWSGRLPDVDASYEEPARWLLSELRPVHHQEQIVHGDIAGNVLRRTDGTRLVIDFSPYIRPVGYAEAIIAVDALLWHRAPESVLDIVDPVDRRQMLLRAALFRLLCDGIFYRDHPLPQSGQVLAGYERVFKAVGDRSS